MLIINAYIVIKFWILIFYRVPLCIIIFEELREFAELYLLHIYRIFKCNK